jgi:hypothetical protein
MHASLPLELWLVVAESFLSKATLYSLFLVSAALNVIFTPDLYKTISLVERWSRWNEKLKKLWELDSEPRVHFTRHLVIRNTKFSPDIMLDPKALRDLIGKMSGLKTCKVWYLFVSSSFQPNHVEHYDSLSP